MLSTGVHLDLCEPSGFSWENQPKIQKEILDIFGNHNNLLSIFYLLIWILLLVKLHKLVKNSSPWRLIT